MIKKQILILVAMGIIGVSFYSGVNSFVKGNINTIEIDSAKFGVIVVDTLAEREKGLSGQAILGANQGMFFDFEQSGMYGFWMKDMLFSLDIIWISQDKKITHIEHDLAPNTYPKVYKPDASSRYVLEVNAGTAMKNNWQVGDEVKF